ncbi:hypothetical protein BOX15_Mlig023015g11 [Macrostomum lignano]|uniref:RNA-directed DNA polymerase n=1 Tax=Macrostomum lignano TaxID=282301 RepID=A0A267DT24_9PLAT|nr:hypothetical protein BOX15_Mlig023015g11 [Macrostomum lignano]
MSAARETAGSDHLPQVLWAGAQGLCLPIEGSGKLLRVGATGAGPTPTPRSNPVLHAIFIPGEANGKPCRWLLDTGAQTSLISDVALRELDGRCELKPADVRPVSVDGSVLELLGSVSITVRLSHQLRRQMDVLVVRGIRPNFILGMDFVSKAARSQFSIDQGAKTVAFDGEAVPFSNCDSKQDGPLSCCLVPTVIIARVQGAVVVPPRSVKVVDVTTETKQAHGIFEPSQEFIDRIGVLPGRVFAVSSESGKIPVQVCNLSCSPVTLFSNQSIGTFESAEVIDEDEDVHEWRGPADQFNINPELPEEDSNRLAMLLRAFADVVSVHEFDVGTSSAAQHKIELDDGARPIRQRPRRVPHAFRRQVDEKLEQMRQHGVIEPSTSPWASNLIIVRKKNNDIRVCVDWRALNNLTVKDAHPLPHLHQALDSLAGCSWFSTIDMRQGFLQVEVREEDRPLTAFYTPSGLMQFRKMGFGMCNAPATYQRMMELIMTGLSWEEVIAYIDDLIIFNRDFENHVQSLSKVLHRLRSAKLKLNPGKSFFAYRSVTYLGHQVSESGIAPAAEKVEAIRRMPEPQSEEDVRRIIGMLSFYRRFVPNFSDIAKPLHHLAQKGAGGGFVWTSEHAAVLNKLKDALTQAPVLQLPDFSRPIVISCDSSAVALGAVLSQERDGQELPVAYASRTLSKAERNYSTTDRELLAIVWSLKQFRMYLSNSCKIQVFTDHKPITGLLNAKEPTGRLARWLQLIQEFPLEILYRPGKENIVPDTLSRAAAVQFQIANLPDEQDQDQVLHAVRHAMLQPNFQVPAAVSASVLKLLPCLTLSPDGALLHNGLPVIPQHMRAELLQQAHDRPSAGHLGQRRVLRALRERSWWPDMREDVRDWVRSCLVCQRRKGAPKRARAELVRQPLPAKPWAVMQLDIKGPLPVTESGKRYIICFVDPFSKWVEAAALSQIDATTVAEALVTCVVLRHGVPGVVHSDQGRQFEAEVFKQTCALLGAEKSRTSPFHPSGNGNVERFNRTLGNMLSAFCSENQASWDALLPYVVWAYSSSEHSSTGESPFKVLRGIEPRLPVDLALGGQRDQPQDCADLQARIRRGFQVVRAHLHTAQKSQHEFYNLGAETTDFKTGDRVMLTHHAMKRGQCKSLSSRWSGPFIVLKKVSPVNYRLQAVNGRRRLLVHHDRLKRFIDRPNLSGRPPAKPATEDDCQSVEDAAGQLAGPDAWEPLRNLDAAEPGNTVRRSGRQRRRPDFYTATC